MVAVTSRKKDPGMNQRISQIVFITVLSMLALLVTACTTTETREDITQAFTGQVTLYMNGPDKPLLDITFELSSINITADDAPPMELLGGPLLINSRDMEGRQIFLGGGSASEGSYNKLQLIIKQATLKKNGRPADLALPSDGVEIDINISVKRNQNITLFLAWNADASVDEGYLFKPVFAVRGKTPELGSLLIYVTNEDADNVSVINRQSGEIIATVMVGDSPRGITAYEGTGRTKVYVANSGSNSISVIDPTTNSVDSEIPIRFGSKPVDIAAARISADKELIFTANYASNNVSVVDVVTLNELEKIEVGRGPIAIAVDPPIETLLGSRFLSFEDASTLRSYREKFINVYVVNYDSHELSIIRFDTGSRRSEEVITLALGWRPVAIDVDYKKGKIYVANYGSDKLSVIDILQIVKGNSIDAVSVINNLGTGIIGVISDPVFERIYLLKESQGEIMIIRPFAKGFENLKTIMPPVMGLISVGMSPRSFVLDPEGRKIYVVNRGSDDISVVDKTTKKEEQLIPVGKKPYGITVLRR